MSFPTAATDVLPRFCARCSCPVIDTDAGYTHLDRSGALAGWVCPAPHTGLARPLPLRRITPIPRRRPSHRSPAPGDGPGPDDDLKDLVTHPAARAV